MSYQRASKAIKLEQTDRIPSLEVLDHPGLIKKLSRLDPYTYPREAAAQAYRKLDIDMIWSLPKEATKLRSGQTCFSENGTIAQAAWGLTPTQVQIKYPFSSPEDVLSYDPILEEKDHQTGMKYTNLEDHTYDQKLLGKDAMVPGWFYNTLFMWPVMTFGWEMFMQVATLYPESFALLLDKFATVSMEYFERWGSSSIEAVISHDDIAMSSGPIFNPEWYRKYIFPWYERLWDLLKKRGKKVIFCSDGNITSLLGELCAVGADGFIIEPVVDLKYVARKNGKEKIIIGGIDTKVLTFGSPDDVKKEVKRITEIFKECPGYFYMAAGSLPGNIPLENLLTYFDTCKDVGSR